MSSAAIHATQQAPNFQAPVPSLPVESLFLPSDPAQLPNLFQLDMPTASVAEAQQQMKIETIDLPFPKQRDSTRMRARVPVVQKCVSPSFVMIWNGFCSARRVVFPRTMEEAEQMVIAETMELQAYANKITPPDQSLLPRPVCMSLVIPNHYCSSTTAINLTDGMAALSDMKTSDGLPITTKVRFSIYGSFFTAPLEKIVRSSAFGEQSCSSISIVLRWTETKPDGSVSIRTELEPINSCSTLDHAETSRVIQNAFVLLARSYGVQLPACMYSPAPLAIPKQFEIQFAKCSDEFCDLMAHRDKFVPSEDAEKSESDLLSLVSGVMLRMSPRALGTKGAMSNSAMHALLLCADGKQDHAREFVMTNREELPPLNAERVSRMRLHTVATQVEPIHLNGMVSLFAHGGKPGEPIQSPNSWIWRSSTAIVPMQNVVGNFIVIGCSMESSMPSRCSLRKFMQAHLQKNFDMFNTTFNQTDVDSMIRAHAPKRKCEEEVMELSEEDRIAMVAIGMNVNSKRMCLGQAITHLMTHTSGKSALVDLMIKASTRLGLSASLESTFVSCMSSMEREDHGVEEHKKEVDRLKRVADAALVMALSRKQNIPTEFKTPSDKVRMLCKAFSLQSGRTTCSVHDLSDMDASVARSMAFTVYEAFNACMTRSMPHEEQVATLFLSKVDIIVLICKALKLCMVPPGVEKDAFVILHGQEHGTAHVFKVGIEGDPVACGIGLAFEASPPVVVVVKMKSEASCFVTPMVRKPT